MPSAARNGSSRSVSRCLTVGRVHVHADAHDAVAFEHGGGGLAEHGDVDGLGDVVGVQAIALRVGVANPQMDRRAGVNQTVEDIHHAGHSRSWPWDRE